MEVVLMAWFMIWARPGPDRLDGELLQEPDTVVKSIITVLR